MVTWYNYVSTCIRHNAWPCHTIINDVHLLCLKDLFYLFQVTTGYIEWHDWNNALKQEGMDYIGLLPV